LRYHRRRPQWRVVTWSTHTGIAIDVRRGPFRRQRVGWVSKEESDLEGLAEAVAEALEYASTLNAMGVCR
jgi:hypothetical protein